MTTETITYAELVQFIKNNSKKITELKSTRKSVPNGYVEGLDAFRYEVRHYHIAHCLLRGRTIEQIEPKVAEGNEYNKYKVEKIMNGVVFPPKEKMEVQNEQVVCNRA